MSTFADVCKAAEADIHTWPADSTPGHFIASTVIVGLVTDYLCVGALDDDTASIVGRIEWPRSGPPERPNANRGTGLKGGQMLSGRWEYATEAFKEMVS